MLAGEKREEDEQVAMNGSARYWLLRRALLAWLAASRRSVRVLGVGRAPKSAAALYICHRFRFLDALIVASVCDQALAIIASREPRGPLQRLLASGLNIIRCRPEPEAWHSALRACTEVLLSGGIVVVLETPESIGPSGDPNHTALALACEAWSGAFPGQSPAVLPIHRFDPGRRENEILIHIGGRVHLDGWSDVQNDVSSSPTSQQVCGKNVFALEDSLLEELFGDLHDALQDRLRERWKVRPTWNQNVDRFRLSSCATECLSRINQHEPETLVALRQGCEMNRETRRQSSLADLRADVGRKQLPIPKQLLRWTEGILGLPVACWGLLNHLIPALLLYVLGLAKRGQRVELETWLARALVVLGGYGGQIALVDGVFGRAAAGYYALTLPMSGAYLFRYWWLLQQSASVSLCGVKALPLRAGKSSGKRLLEKLDQILATAVTVPPLGSP